MGRQYFILLLIILSYGFQNVLESQGNDIARVNGIRFGGSNKETRMVLDLDRDVNLEIDQKSEGHFVISSPDKALDASNIFPQSHDLVESITPVQKNDGSYNIQVHATPGTHVKKSFMLDGKGDEKRYVVDFAFDKNKRLVAPKEFSKVTAQHVSQQKISSNPSQNMKSLAKRLETTNKEEDPFSDANLPKLVTDLTIKTSSSQTTLTLTLAKSGSFTVRENEYTNEVIIEMPKFDWTGTNFVEKKGGVIENYIMDESDPKHVSLILKVHPGTVVLGKFTLPRRNTTPAKFVLTLGDSSMTESPMPALMPQNQPPKVDYQPPSSSTKQVPAGYVAAKTPPAPPGPEFMGGDVAFADVGIGFYMGGQLGHGSGSVKTNSTLSNNAPNFYSLNQSVEGGIASLHMGYGFGFNKFYFGLEAFGQLMSVAGNNGAGDSYTKYKDSMPLTYGALIRLGAYLAPEVMAYGSVGGVGTVLKHKVLSGNSPTYGISGRYRTTMSGTLVGAGLEAALDDHLSLRLDYHYIFYQVLGKTVPSLGNSAIIQTATIAPKLSQLLVGLSYKFSPMFGPNSRENLGLIPTGLYVGTGPAMSALSISRQTTTGRTTRSTAQVLTPQWDLYAGYGHQDGTIYMGGEASISFGNKMIEETYTQNNTQEKRTDKLRASLTLAFRPGFTFGQGNLVYGRIGGIVSRLTHDGTAASNSQFTLGQNFGRTIYGLAFGGGLEAFINKNLSIRGDYTYEDYQHINISNAALGTKLGPNNKKFLLGIAYTF